MAFMTRDQDSALTQLLRLAGEKALQMQPAVSLPSNSGTNLAQFVNDVAKTVEDQIVSYLLSKYAGDYISVRDEIVQSECTSGADWIVIPMDGHDNFARGNPHWSIAMYRYDITNTENFFLSINFPALKTVFQAGINFPPNINGTLMPRLRSSGLSRPVVALGTKASDAKAAYPPLPGEENWISRDFGCITFSVLELARGCLDGYHSWDEPLWMAVLMTKLVWVMGGRTITIDATHKMNGPLPFTCGNAKFIEEIQQGLKASSAAQKDEQGLETSEEDYVTARETAVEASDKTSEDSSEDISDEALRKRLTRLLRTLGNYWMPEAP